jgi:plasmid stability protein
MTKMIQIRNVPEGVHRQVKARAAKAGMSLSEYLGREVERLAETPTVDDIEARLAALPPVAGSIDVVAEIRAIREERTDHLVRVARGSSAQDVHE